MRGLMRWGKSTLSSVRCCPSFKNPAVYAFVLNRSIAGEAIAQSKIRMLAPKIAAVAPLILIAQPPNEAPTAIIYIFEIKLYFCSQYKISANFRKEKRSIYKTLRCDTFFRNSSIIAKKISVFSGAYIITLSSSNDI